MKSNIWTIFLVKVLITIILMLIVLVLIKSSTGFKNLFYKKVYSNSFSFAKITNLYNKYIGDIDFFNDKEQMVFNEKILYNKIEKYKEGAKLDVGTSYSVPAEKEGIVVFIGEKEGYNNTVVVQRIDGIDEWYGNISNENVKLYDYVKKGTVLGEANSFLYLVYMKDEIVLNYEDYIK